jgi:ABC-type multidrug transport system ATPase subunit
MDEAERCNTVSVIYQGKILTTGIPAELEEKMPFRIVEVKAKTRRTLREVADQTKGVVGWRAVGDRLRLSVSDPAEVLPRIEQALKKAGAETSILREARLQMEDVFIHLVEKREVFA